MPLRCERSKQRVRINSLSRPSPGVTGTKNRLNQTAGSLSLCLFAALFITKVWRWWSDANSDVFSPIADAKKAAEGLAGKKK